MSTRVIAGGRWRRTVPRRRHARTQARGARSRVPALLISAFVTVGLVACGNGDPGAADVAVLADRADRLAEHLDAGEGCLAEREGNDLVARAQDAVAADHLPQEAADEIRAVVAEVTAEVPCDDATTEEVPATEEEREDAEEGRVEDEGAEDEDAEDEGAKENGGRGNNGNGPPGRSEQGPPGQRGNSGRGR